MLRRKASGCALLPKDLPQWACPMKSGWRDNFLFMTRCMSLHRHQSGALLQVDLLKPSPSYPAFQGSFIREEAELRLHRAGAELSPVKRRNNQSAIDTSCSPSSGSTL